MSDNCRRQRTARARRIRRWLVGVLVLCSSTVAILSPSGSAKVATAQSAFGSTIAGSGDHSLALRSDGTVWAFGWNEFGQLGTTTNSGTLDPNPIPTQVAGLSGVIEVAAGFSHSFALRSDGTVWAFGRNESGQLGTTVNNGNWNANPTPNQVPGLSGVIAVSIGEEFSLALRSDGTVWSFGYNDGGQLGTSNDDLSHYFDPSPTPTQVPGLSGVIAISAGWHHSLVLRSDGTVWSFGNNDAGQLGRNSDGVSSVNPTATQVAGLSGVTAIAAGGAFSLALRSDATVWAFGANHFGQLGTTINNGIFNDIPNPTPAQVPGLSGVTAIAAGIDHSLALRSDGTVWAFGRNFFGSLGTATNNETSNPNPTPAQVPGLSGVTAVVAGREHSLALGSDGTVWGFGANYFGQVGARTSYQFDPNPTPTRVSGLSGVAQPDSAAPVDETMIAPGFVALAPARFLDSRVGASTVDGEFAGIGSRPAGSVTYLSVAGRDGVPADTSAVVLNVTVTDPQAAGFVTVWPCATPMPNASNLNYTTGQTIPNAVTTKIGADGKICIYTLATTHLIADLNGYHPADSPFVATTPARLLDSRAGTSTVDGQFSGIGTRPAGSVTELQVAGRDGVPADTPAAVLNVTVTDPQAAGFVTVWPCGTPMPNASNLNYTTGQTIPNAVTTKIGADGKICIYTSSATDLIADLDGYHPQDSP